MALPRLCFLVMCLLYVPACITAQEKLHYAFRYIDQANGLIHNQVYGITQDGKGFIWLGTTNGLQRYDGSRFIYYPDIMSSPIEGLTYGVAMSVDKQQDLLWVNKNTNTEKIVLGTQKQTVYNPDQLLTDSSFSFHSYLTADHNNWLVGQHAFFVYDSLLKKYSIYHLNVTAPGSHQSAFLSTSKDGNITWATMRSGLAMFDKRDGLVYNRLYNPFKHPLLSLTLDGKTNSSFRFVMTDSRNNIWVTTWGDLFFRYDAASGRMNSFSLASIKKMEDGPGASPGGLLINSIIEDDNGQTWIGTENAGLLRYNKANNSFDYCSSNDNSGDGVRYNYKIFCLFQDRERNIWIGTDRGISIFNPYQQYFKTVSHKENDPLSISKSEIESFIQLQNGDMLAGTWGAGMAVYDRDMHFKKNIVFNDIPEKNFVWSFLQVDASTAWIGCQHGYLLIYDLNTGRFKTLHPPQMEGSTIRCMEKDNKGNTWFGLHNGMITEWDSAKQQFISYRGNRNEVAPYASVFNLFIDKDQHCWASTDVGFKEFDLGKGEFIHTWLPEAGNPSSISGIACRGIEAFNDSILLIGTTYGGINFFNKKTRKFSHLTTVDGLPSNTVYALRKDTAGYVWFTTDYGLYKFRPPGKKFIFYNMEPGIVNASFVANRFYPLLNREWLTYTSSELVSFLPESLYARDSMKHKVEITGFKIFDKSFFIDSLLEKNNPLRLTYKQNFFTIEFSALLFSELKQTNYNYRLTGVDKDWVLGGISGFASYTDLQPGEYKFEVKAGNGETNGEITSFMIIIDPPFWKTGWFIAAVTVSLLLLGLRFIKWREKNIRLIAAEKIKVQQLNAEQLANKLELEQIINYFSSSLVDKNTVDDVLWDVARNLIGRLGFTDCMIYLWNAGKTKMVQKAGFGPKGSKEEINKQPFDVTGGQGIVGYVMNTKESLLVPDTSKDARYRADEMVRLSEITVPVKYNNELLGVIDSEHIERNFYTARHLQILNTIATLMANKIKSIEDEQALQQADIAMYSIKEQLSNAKLEVLRSQMNPHFIFNCINSIDALIHSNDKYNATVYLNKFARLLRNILDGSKQNTVSFSRDIDTLKLYIELEEMRNENKFKTVFQIEEQLLNSDYKVPPLIVQPFVENAILHGIKNMETNDGLLIIKIRKTGDRIQYIITDNGIGRAAAEKIMQNKESHYGMQMSFDRVKLFNREETASVKIDDLETDGNPAGTRITVNLNIY